MQNEKGEPSAAAKAIQRTLNRLLIATVVLYGILAIAGVYVYFQGNTTKKALCAFRVDLEKRTVAGLDFLRDHPQGIPGISRAQLLTSVTNQQRTIVTLQGLDCEEDTPVELLVIPPDLSPQNTPTPKTEPKSGEQGARERQALLLAQAGIQPEEGNAPRQTPTTTSGPTTGNQGPRGEPGPQGDPGAPGTPAPEKPPERNTPAPRNPVVPVPSIPSTPKPPAPVPDPRPPPAPKPPAPIQDTVCGVLEIVKVPCR